MVRYSSSTATPFYTFFDAGKDSLQIIRKGLQLRLLTTDHLDDVIAGLSFLTKLPRVDANRIAIAGHSFGGQLTLLAAERKRMGKPQVLKIYPAIGKTSEEGHNFVYSAVGSLGNRSL